MSKSERPLSCGVELARLRLELRNMKQQNSAYRWRLKELERQAKHWRDVARSLGARTMTTSKWRAAV